MAIKIRLKAQLEQKYSKFIDNIFGDPEISMTNKLALLCTIFSIANCIILILISFKAEFIPIISIGIYAMIAVIFVSLYLILIHQRAIMAANISIIFLSIVYLPIMWFYTGGINGSASLILFMLLIFNSILNSDSTRLGIATSQFLIVLILFYSEITFPQTVINLAPASESKIGVMLNMFYILVSTTMVTTYFIDQYKHTLSQVQATNEQLNIANNDLRLAAQFRKDLIANISHDLNTPITMICGYAEAINDGLLKQEQTSKYLSLIHRKAMDLSTLIDDLVHLTKLENRQLELEFETVAVKDLYNQTEKKFAYDIQLKGLEFIVSPLPTELQNALVKIDINQIDKVFNNLIYNAMKFTTEGSITLSCLPSSSNNIVFSIADTGIGIDETVLPYIFERFYKGSSSRNSQSQGSGLGLNISQKIILLHGGEIWATSSIGKGSTFYFSLPLAL